MTGRLLGAWPDNSPQWLEARRSRIGGSDVAGILGLSPWQSPYSVWVEKSGLVPSRAATTEQARGHYLEPAVAAWYTDQHPEQRVTEAGTYVHQDRDWQLANPDRMLRDGILEIKTDANGNSKGEWGRPGTDAIPVYYRTQAVWYCDVLGVDWVAVAVLTSRLRFVEYRVAADPDDAAFMRRAAAEMLDRVLWGDPVDLDDHPATYAALQAQHPDIDHDAHVDLTPDVAAEFVAAHRAEIAAAKRKAAAATRLAQVMGRARSAYCGGRLIATRRAKAGGAPYVQAANDLPDPTTLETTP